MFSWNLPSRSLSPLDLTWPSEVAFPFSYSKNAMSQQYSVPGQTYTIPSTFPHWSSRLQPSQITLLWTNSNLSTSFLKCGTKNGSFIPIHLFKWKLNPLADLIPWNPLIFNNAATSIGPGIVSYIVGKKSQNMFFIRQPYPSIRHVQYANWVAGRGVKGFKRNCVMKANNCNLLFTGFGEHRKIISPKESLCKTHRVDLLVWELTWDQSTYCGINLTEPLLSSSFYL